MYVKEVLVQNKAGLRGRPATFFIQKANEFKFMDQRLNALVGQTIHFSNNFRVKDEA